jgi:DoxX-like protein
MAVVRSTALTGDNASAYRRRRAVAYWVATAIVAGNAVAAGMIDILRVQPFFGILLHLGYPAYFGAILGTWKVLGAVALLAPRYPLVKEWAYAGSFVDYTAAVASYMAVGDGLASNLVGPIISIVFLIVSWALRPPSRRVAASCSTGSDSSGERLHPGASDQSARVVV